MSRSLQEEGEKLIYESERILRRDVQGALDDGDFNIVVRRAQEVVKLALKGALKILGVDYPRVHDVASVRDTLSDAIYAPFHAVASVLNSRRSAVGGQ